MYGINKKLQLHFIGIGGIGMSGIAEVLLNLGYKVSGSDLSESTSVLDRLRSFGAKIYTGHRESHVDDADIVIYSSAINESNPEYSAALKKQVPIIRRAEMLAELMRLKFGIAVAGSHGKTTTTSFLATIMTKLNFDPTFIVGGIVKNLGSNAGLGSGNYLIAEADESDGSFLYLNPIISIITNIDNDHLDYYKTKDALMDAFINFSNKVPFYGHLVLNAHDENIGKSLARIRRPFVTFGFEDEKVYVEKLNYTISNLISKDEHLLFTVSCDEESQVFEIKLHGRHNVMNAAGAIIVAHKLGAPLSEIAKCIHNFEGVGRRLEIVKQTDYLTVIDDYGHHPTEIKATIQAIESKYGKEKINIVFQPHRYSRSKTFWSDFVDVLNINHKTYILPIYAAGEEEIPYIDSEIMVKNINESGGNAEYLEDIELLKSTFAVESSEKRIFLILGAGTISRMIRDII